MADTAANTGAYAGAGTRTHTRRDTATIPRRHSTADALTGHVHIHTRRDLIVRGLVELALVEGGPHEVVARDVAEGLAVGGVGGLGVEHVAREGRVRAVVGGGLVDFVIHGGGGVMG